VPFSAKSGCFESPPLPPTPCNATNLQQNARTKIFFVSMLVSCEEPVDSEVLNLPAQRTLLVVFIIHHSFIIFFIFHDLSSSFIIHRHNLHLHHHPSFIIIHLSFFAFGFAKTSVPEAS
jgi:hypothetical protein